MARSKKRPSPERQELLKRVQIVDSSVCAGVEVLVDGVSTALCNERDLLVTWARRNLRLSEDEMRAVMRAYRGTRV